MAQKKKKGIEKENRKDKARLEKQVKMIIVVMAIGILLVLFFYWYVINSKKFSYAGVEFTKGKEGSLTLYLAKFPVRDKSGETVSSINIYFREDPRKLERIKINMPVQIKNNVAIAADRKFIENCSDSILAAATLSAFLTRAGVSVFPATTDKQEAREYNRTYVDCSFSSETTILSLKIGNESKIIRDEDCYTLEAGNNCEIMNVTEKFMIELYATSQGIAV